MAHASVQDISLRTRQAFAAAAEVPDEPRQRREALDQVDPFIASSHVMLPMHTDEGKSAKAAPIR